MIATLTTYEIGLFFESDDIKLNRLSPPCRLPALILMHMALARFCELGRGPIPYFARLAGLTGMHAWQVETDREHFLIHIGVLDTDPLAKARTFDDALDMLDIQNDVLKDVPVMRSAVIREIVNAVPDLTDKQSAELAAYGRAAGM